jgi:hemerythrin superfamily protein
MGGARSVLARQTRDHIELDRLIRAVDESSSSQRQEYLNQLCRLVFSHAFAEESVLWPAIRRWVPEGEQLTLEIEREHQEINELFTKLETLDVDSEEFERLWGPRVVRLLREDVRDEEDRLLPMLQRGVNQRTVVQLGWAWQAVRNVSPTRPHPVVARRPPGNARAATPLTILDRSRDQLDRVSRRSSGQLSSLTRKVSMALARVAGSIEHVPPFTRGEDPSTHSGRISRPIKDPTTEH